MMGKIKTLSWERVDRATPGTGVGRDAKTYLVPPPRGRQGIYRFSSSGITPRLEMVLGVISPASVRAILVRIGPTSS